MLHPMEPPLRQRGDIGPDDRVEADMTGVGEQHRAQTDGRVPDSCGSFTDMGEGMCKPRARVNFKEHRREIDAGEAREDSIGFCRKVAFLRVWARPVSVRVSRPVTGLIRTAALVGKCASVR